jgi:hypothetical protein
LALLAILPLVIGWSELPDPVATHWGLGGVPDGATSKLWLWVLPVAIVLLGLVVSMLMHRDGKPSAESFALVGLLGGMAIWTSTSVVLLNAGAASWEEAGTFDLWQIAGLVVTAGLTGWVGYLLGRRWYPPVHREVGLETPVREVGDDETATWTGSVTVWWPMYLLVPIGVVFLFLPGWLKWLAALYFVIAFLFSRVMVTVDDRGLRVRLAGWVTVRTIGLDEVASAHAIDLEPTEWAGWGYRMVPGGSAVVLRRGNAIEVALRNDRRFAVTVDDAATGAALLNGLVARLARR